MTPSDLTIRRLEPEPDAAAYRDIRLESLRLAPSAFGSDLATESAHPQSWFAERLAKTAVFGAFSGGALAGVAGLMFEESPKRAHKGHLWGVYVRPAARSAGTARRLGMAVLEYAQGRVEIVQLTVERGNPHARRLYTSLGFQEYGLEKDAMKVDGSYHDNVLMALDLRSK